MCKATRYQNQFLQKFVKQIHRLFDGFEIALLALGGSYMDTILI